jgi:energy-coupling factor transporter ATP-binding protein EcfA2
LRGGFLEQHKQLSPTDNPIHSLEEDEMDREKFVRRLCSELINPNTKQATGLKIGITGEWGSGKSSILNMLEKVVKETYPDGALIIRFDPWLVSGRDDLIVQFFKQLLGTIGRNNSLKDKLSGFTEIVLLYADALETAGHTVYPGLGFSVRLIHLFKSKTKDIYALRNEVENFLEEIELPILVMIDELDRVDDKEVHAVAQLVRAVMDFPNISYVLAYDDVRVAEALGGEGADKLERGRAYLEKIVQLPIRIPHTLPSEVRALFEAQLSPTEERASINSPLNLQSRYEELCKIIFPDLIKTLRDVKRLISKYSVLAELVGNEIDNIDLLAYTALTLKAPRTVELIERNIRDYVDDNLTKSDFEYHFHEYTENETLEQKFARKIATNERSSKIDGLIGFLFSNAFDLPRQHEITGQSLCRRRPLLTVLRLGLLPGDYSTAEINDFLDKPETEMVDFIQNIVVEEKFANYWQRLWDVYLYNDFESDIHHKFWSAMRQFVQKNDSHWNGNPSVMRDITDNVIDLFEVKFFNEDEQARELGCSILNELYDAGDVEIVPSIIRKHFFVYGLFGKDNRGGKYLLSEEETIEFANCISEDVIPRILNDDLLISLRDPQLLFLIVDVNDGLSDELRSYFDSLVRNDIALPAISLFFNGPNYRSDNSVMENFFDPETLRQRVEEKLQQDDAGEIELDPSVKESFRKIIEPWP